MTSVGRKVDGIVSEQQLAVLFTPDCDPYAAGAAALFGKAQDAITQDERDLTKRVFMRIAARRGLGADGYVVQTLRLAADKLHEVGSAAAAEDLVPRCSNEILANKLRENLRSHDQIKRITADGFELCVRALAEMGATDVTIHECGESTIHECSESVCTGTLVHDEFTACPVHDLRRR